MEPVTLKFGSKEFLCCRSELSRSSPYFAAMFKHDFVEKRKKVIEIKDVDPDAMEILLMMLQTKDYPRERVKSNVSSVLQASSMLQFDTIQKMCINIISQSLSVDTCHETMRICYALDIPELHKKAKTFALWEFRSVVKTSAFLNLNIEELENYLSNDWLNTSNGEFEVFEAGINWVQEIPERSQYIERILKCVRFKDISVTDIKTIILYPITVDYENLLNTIMWLKEKQGDNEKNKFLKPEDTEIDCDHLINKSDATECKRTNHLKCPSIYCCICPKNLISENRSPSEDESINHRISVIETSDVDISESFYQQNVQLAFNLLNIPSRMLPLVPCIIGQKMDKKSLTCSIKRPYLIYFDEKTRLPVPFLHLSKINEGATELIGYQVVNRGMELYIIGGEYMLGHGNWNKSVWKYDLLKEEWMYETSLQVPVRHHSVCTFNDDIFLVGGFGRHRVVSAAVVKYNVKSKDWTRSSSLPMSMNLVACCVHKGYMFVFGFNVYMYHIDSDTWHTVKSFSCLVTAFNCAMSHMNSIYLTGSYSQNLIRFYPEIPSQGVECDGSIETLGSFQNVPSGACLINGKIYTFAANESNLMSVEAYDIATSSFEILWEGTEGEANGVVDFSIKGNYGCFPLAMFDI